MDENIHYIKAGVGGTPSELGMIRYERDVCRDGAVTPDIVVVEFSVNDEGDETKGVCYESLVRKILAAKNKPAVILLLQCLLMIGICKRGFVWWVSTINCQWSARGIVWWSSFTKKRARAG